MAARAKVERTIRLVRPPGADGVAVVCVRAGDESAFYTVREIPCAIGGRGFAVHRLGLGTVYHVRVGEPADCSCECLGWLARQKCRHVLGLRALVGAGQL
jgi:SWIM zinc finger